MKKFEKEKKTGTIGDPAEAGNGDNTSTSDSSNTSSSDDDEPDMFGDFCTAIGADDESIDNLILSYYLDMDELFTLEKDKFIEKLTEYRVDCVEALSKKMTEWRESYERDEKTYKAVFKHAFHLLREEDAKVVDIDQAVAILSEFARSKPDKPHLNAFINFLENQQSTKVINQDQWVEFLEFSLTIPEDFSSYDPAEAWPVLLDEYVEWSKVAPSSQNKPSPSSSSDTDVDTPAAVAPQQDTDSSESSSDLWSD
eukprot:CAMPEP_0201551606 /NCGR_PEP_ID=MMETSP0173_2-20130828/7746_1 /ASSEMBLY_ACC=CAM_ASM_000268 /TAXON_ID=218659 /ORGANISM="Vexillifera sp., Strain DIVA3 564/2" /LENGTH=253 /DNA_ID=CAMNT_0047961901 /DNA_START=606 /DNA_END=1367 /DNA_ORIENTATION=-